MHFPFAFPSSPKFSFIHIKSPYFCVYVCVARRHGCIYVQCVWQLELDFRCSFILYLISEARSLRKSAAYQLVTLTREPLGFCYLSRAVVWCTLPTTDVGNWTQIFMHTRWALYQLSHPHSPWYFYFQFCSLNPWEEQDDDKSKGGLGMHLRAGRHA